jgi:hypothetical protein
VTTPRRTATLLAGLRTLLLAAGVTPVQMGLFTPANPDACTAIIPYPITDDLETGTVLQAVQVVIRGAATAGVQPVLDTQDNALAVLGNLRDRTVGGIHVTLCWRQTSAPLSPDGSGRPEIRDTYYLRTDRLGYAG